MNPRSEPLLWLQLVALGAIPLELLGLLLVLAGADPGPLPALERLLAWAIGALGPALLLWQRPADVCSLLLVQVPIRARSEAQRCLAALQSPLPVQLAMALGAAGLLPLFWWMDQHAALAAPLSPLAASPRFVSLLLACPLLALILWQWQQLIQAIALLTRRQDASPAPAALSPSQLETQRLSLGLPLLLLSPLQLASPKAPEEQRKPEPQPVPEAQPSSAPSEGTGEPSAEPRAESTPSAVPGWETGPINAANLDTATDPEASSTIAADASLGGTVAVEPEQATEEAESSELDQEIS